MLIEHEVKQLNIPIVTGITDTDRVNFIEAHPHVVEGTKVEGQWMYQLRGDEVVLVSADLRRQLDYYIVRERKRNAIQELEKELQKIKE